MASSTTLREFLYRLGWKIDESSKARFDATLASGMKGALGLGAAIEGAAVAVEAAVVKMGSNLERLYWQSRRTGSSAKDIDAFSFAVGQMGGSAEAARAALERLSWQAKSNPAFAQAIRNFGAEPVFNKEGALDAERTVERILRRVRDMTAAGQGPQAIWWAQSLGLDPDTIQAGIRGLDVMEERRRRFAREFGVDLDRESAKATGFMQRLRDLGSAAYFAFTRVGAALLDRLAPSLDKALGWLLNGRQKSGQSNVDWLVGQITYATNKVLDLSKIIERWAVKLYDGLQWLDDKTGGWSTKLLALGVAAKLLGVSIIPLVTSLAANPIIAGILALGVAISVLALDYENFQKTGQSGLGIDWKTMASDAEALRDGLRRLGDEIGYVGKQLAKINLDPTKMIQDGIHGSIDAVNLLLDLLTGRWTRVWHDALGVLENHPLWKLWRNTVGRLMEGAVNVATSPAVKGTLGVVGENAAMTGKAVGLAALGPAFWHRRGAEPLGLSLNNPGNLRSWGNTPVEKGFAHFSTMNAGLEAMAGNLIQYGAKYQLNTVRDIVSRWAPRSENDTGAYVADVSKRLGVGADQPLQLGSPSVLTDLMMAMIRHEQGYVPAYGDVFSAANTRLGADSAAGRDVTINQTNNVNVHGSDAPAIGREVASRVTESGSRIAQQVPTVR